MSGDAVEEIIDPCEDSVASWDEAPASVLVDVFSPPGGMLLDCVVDPNVTGVLGSPE